MGDFIFGSAINSLQPESILLKLERAKKKEPRKGEEEKKMKRRKKKKGRRYIWIPCGIHDPNSHQTQQGVAIFFFPRWSEEKKKKKLQQILRLLCDSS